MKGILLMAYGSPATMADVEAYYTHIRGGRKPDGPQLENLTARYRAIGGPSPLLKITEMQARGLQRSLESVGSRTRVFAGMKHSPPFIGDVMTEAASGGVDELLCIALAPHYSSISIGGYMRAVDDARSRIGNIRVEFVKSWHDTPELISMWQALVSRAANGAGSDPALVFSAHSLPERIIAEGDPYRDQLLRTSGLVAEGAGWKEWSFAFQSASTTGEPWLGPDILEHLESLRAKGRRNFLLAPIGFLSDHLEILYDIDVECKRWAVEHDAGLVRCELPNDSPELIACLRGIASRHGFT